MLQRPLLVSRYSIIMKPSKPFALPNQEHSFIPRKDIDDHRCDSKGDSKSSPESHTTSLPFESAGTHLFFSHHSWVTKKGRRSSSRKGRQQCPEFFSSSHKQTHHPPSVCLSAVCLSVYLFLCLSVMPYQIENQLKPKTPPSELKPNNTHPDQKQICHGPLIMTRQAKPTYRFLHHIRSNYM